jgi:hypothetical protein
MLFLLYVEDTSEMEFIDFFALNVDETRDSGASYTERRSDGKEL